MRPEPSIIPGIGDRSAAQGAVNQIGKTLVLHEWDGSGAGYLHVHHEDDEAWHVLEGMVRFRFEDRQVDAAAGATVFVPAGVAHDYEVLGKTRYLLILTPRLNELIEELHRAPFSEHGEVMLRYRSERLE